MKKADQYKVSYRPYGTGRIITRKRRDFLGAMGDALSLLDGRYQMVRLDGPDGYVDLTLLAEKLRGKPLTRPCFYGASLEFSEWWNSLEGAYVPGVYDFDTERVRFYHSPEEGLVAVCRAIFMPDDDLGDMRFTLPACLDV